MRPLKFELFKRSLLFANAFLTFSLSSVTILGAQDGLEGGIDASQDALQNAKPKESPRLIPWRAIVIYENGGLLKVEPSGRSTGLSFKDAIYEGDQIELRAGSGRIAKLRLRETCILAVYADRSNSSNATITPALENEPWQVRADAIRILAPENLGCELQFKGTRVSMGPHSEVLIDGVSALAPQGNVRIGDPKVARVEPLRNDSVYRFDSKERQWKPNPQIEPYDFQSSRKLMAGSKTIDPPPKVASLRISLGPIFGTTSAFFDKEYLRTRGLSAEGARLQAQWHAPFLKGFLGSDPSLIGVFHFRNTDNESYGAVSAESAKVRTEFLGGEIGVRFHHDRWWSPFARFGFGREKSREDISYPSQSYFRSERIEFHSISLAAGVDALYRPTLVSWLGLYASAELHLTQSLGRGERENTSGGTPNASARGEFTEEPWRLTTLSVLLNAGLLVQFY